MSSFRLGKPPSSRLAGSCQRTYFIALHLWPGGSLTFSLSKTQASSNWAWARGRLRKAASLEPRREAESGGKSRGLGGLVPKLRCWWAERVLPGTPRTEADGPPPPSTAGPGFTLLGVSPQTSAEGPGCPLEPAGRSRDHPARDRLGTPTSLKLQARTVQARDKPQEGGKGLPLFSENTFLF